MCLGRFALGVSQPFDGQSRERAATPKPPPTRPLRLLPSAQGAQAALVLDNPRRKLHIGDRRPPSPLDKIQPVHWLDEYTLDLINLVHVLDRLVALEPAQANLLARICAGQLIASDSSEDDG